MSNEQQEHEAAMAKLDAAIVELDRPRMSEDEYVDYIADRVIARLKEREADDAR